jgi:hypothetical protein
MDNGAGHDAQLPMWSAQELDDLRQAARSLAEAAQFELQLLREQRQWFQQQVREKNVRQDPTRSVGGPRPVRSRKPANERHRTWRGFVETMQELEAHARELDLKPTKRAVCQFGADSPKTVTRTMTDYGLRPDDWPPSGWDPGKPPAGASGHK